MIQKTSTKTFASIKMLLFIKLVVFYIAFAKVYSNELLSDVIQKDNLRLCQGASCPPEYSCTILDGTGTRCTCNTGYVIDKKIPSRCIDFDECSVYGTCDQRCMNTIGSYFCYCQKGYEWAEDEHRCKTSDLSAPAMYIGTNFNLTIINLNGTAAKILVSGAIGDIDISFATKTVFWIDKNLEKIFQTNDFSQTKKDIRVHGLPDPCSLAFDWIGNNLYIMDCSLQRIAVANAVSHKQKYLILDGILYGLAIAVDPLIGFLFYIDYCQPPKILPRIVRAHMDGTGSHDLEIRNMHSPSGLALDLAARRIYWVDTALRTIESVDYYGMIRVPIVSGNLDTYAPVGIALFEDQIYWANEKAVLNVGKFNKSNSTVKPLWQSPDTLLSIKIAHSSLQPRFGREANPCNGSKCEHLCVLSHISDDDALGYRCLCEAGYQIDDDDISCKRIDEFLIINTKFSIRGIPLGDKTPPMTDAFVNVIDQTRPPHSSNFVAVDYDARTMELYYSDISLKSIYKYTLNDTGITTISAQEAEGLGLDWISRNLYFTDIRAKTLSVLRLQDPTQSRVLITDLGNPRSVAVHPNKGYVFFGDWLSTNNSSFIGRCDGDGSNLIKIPSYGWPNGICIDYEKDRVYWVDAYKDR